MLHRIWDAFSSPGKRNESQEDGETKFTYHVKNVHKDNSSTATGGSAPDPAWLHRVQNALSGPGEQDIRREDIISTRRNLVRQSSLTI